MSLRCREGDLAIVVYDIPECAANIGHVVRVRGPVQYNLEYGKSCWLITPVQPVLWMVDDRGRIATEKVLWNSLVEHPDGWLLPIRPDELDKVVDYAQGKLDVFLMGVQKELTDLRIRRTSKEGQ